jgi:cobalt-zinc-cadmium efflux system outer membrane protein
MAQNNPSHLLRNACLPVLAAVLCLHAPLLAQTQTVAPAASSAPLTLQQVLEIARTKNPTLLAAEKNVLSVQAEEVQAGVRQNPYFTVYGTNLTNPATSATPYAYSLQLARLFERGQKRRWRLDSARSTTVQTRQQAQDQQRQVLLQVKLAFTNMLLAKAALQLAKDNLASYTHELAISKERYTAGDIGKLDYERLDLQLAQFETDEAGAEANLAQSSDQLQTLLGYEHPQPGFDITGDLQPPALTLTLPELEQRALANRPDYQAAQSAVRVAEANVRLAQANGTADPTLEGEYDHSGNLSSFGFYVTVPVRIFDRNQGNKAVAKFQAQSVQLTEVAARNQVLSDVDQAWVAYTTAKLVSDRYQGHYLAEAKDVLTIAQYSYEHGGLALLDYLDALQDDRTTSLNALTAYAQTWDAIHQLSYTTAGEVVNQK